MNPSTITLLMPVLNEIDGLRALLPQIDRSLFDEVVIVDGGSNDGSVEFALAAGLRVIRQRRKGLAFGVFDALKELSTEYVIEFSPDGNCRPEDLAPLVAELSQGYDLVVVSRYLPGARSYDDTAVTAFGNWVFTQSIRWLGRFPVTDSLTIYRGFRRSICLDGEFENYLRGPVLEPLVTAWATLAQMKICEIPGDEPARIGGEQKMRVIYNGSCILWMVFRLYWRKLLRGFGSSK